MLSGKLDFLFGVQFRLMLGEVSSASMWIVFALSFIYEQDILDKIRKGFGECFDKVTNSVYFVESPTETLNVV